MSLLDKKYILTVNLEDSSIFYPFGMSFFNTDENIAILYVRVQYKNDIINYLSKEDAINYNIKLTIVKPKTNALREIEGVITDEIGEDCAIYKFKLPSEFTDQVGEVACEFVITNLEEKLTIAPFSYEIKASKVTGLNSEITINPDLPILKQLIEETKKAQQWISNIDDTNVSEVKTYSNKKIDNIKKNIDEQFISVAKKDEVFSMVNMGQDVKEAMTGGSVAVVGKNVILDENIVEKQVKYTKTDFITSGKNLINKENMVLGKYIRHDSNGIIQENANYYLSDYIPVLANVDYYISSCRFIAFFDVNRIAANGWESSDNSGITFRTTINGYIRVSVNKLDTYIKRLQLEVGTIKTEYEDFKLIAPKIKINENNCDDGLLLKINATSNILKGKILLNLGDSIAYGSGNNGVGYAEIIANKYEMTYVDYSNGGATVAKQASNNILDQLQTAIDSGVQPDYVIFDGGTNDIVTDKNIALGTITTAWSGQAIDETTYIGGMESMCKKIKNTFPNSKVVWVRVHNMASRDYSKQIEYGEAGVKVCEKWGVIVVDLFKNSNLNTNINTMWQFTNNNDKTHPNENGYLNYYIPQIENKLLNI